MIIAKEHLTAEGRLKIKSLIDKSAAGIFLYGTDALPPKVDDFDH